MEHRYWLLTWTTNATRLPGDRRGFVSTVRRPSGERTRHNTPGTPLDRDNPALRRAALDALREPPVLLTASQAHTVLGEIRATARIQRWPLLVAAVMANHVHLVVGLPPPGDTEEALAALGRFKAFGARELNRAYGRRVAWWTQGGSRRVLRSELAVGAGVRYVAEQKGCLALWVEAEWKELLGRL